MQLKIVLKDYFIYKSKENIFNINIAQKRRFFYIFFVFLACDTVTNYICTTENNI